MINDEKSYYIKRRFAFWQNFSRNLDDLIQDFEAQSAGKFVDDYDRNFIEGIHSALRHASILALKRYHSALGEFIQDTEKGGEC